MAFIDLEAFKGHAYPDVLLSILIETLHGFDDWLATAGISATTKKRWWNKFWGGKPERPPLEKRKLEEVRKRLQDEKELLTRLLHSEDDAELVQRTGESKKTTSRNQSSASVKTGASANIAGAKADVSVSFDLALPCRISSLGNRQCAQVVRIAPMSPRCLQTREAAVKTALS